MNSEKRLSQYFSSGAPHLSVSHHARVGIEGMDKLVNPLPWYQRKLIRVCLSILVVEACERLCFYSLTGTQKFLLQEFGFNNASASALTNVFNMIVYGSCIAGGWIADTYWGRFKTIAVGGTIYAAGAYLASFGALPTVTTNSDGVEVATFPMQTMYFIGIYGIVAVMSGAIKPNVANLGADQYDTTDPIEAQECESFFNWFYFVINLGAILAFGVFANWATAGVGGISKPYGFFFVFMIASVAMTIGMVIYFARSKIYVKKPTEGNSMGALFHYLGQARKRGGHKGMVMFISWCILPVWFILTVISGFITSSGIKAPYYISMVLIVLFLAGIVYAHRYNSWMDHFEDYPGVKSKDFQAAMDVVPTIAIVSTFFNICYYTMNTVWMSQSCQMDLMISSTGQLSGAMLNTADALSILAFTPIYTSVVIPTYKRCRGIDMSKAVQFTTGLVIAILGCVLAGFIEIARRGSPLIKDELNGGGRQINDIYNISGPPYDATVPLLNSTSPYRSNCAASVLIGDVRYNMVMSQMSAAYMIFPFMCIGIGEVFVNAGMYAFTYSNTPTSMRSLMQAFTLLSQGTLSNGIIASLSILMESWMPNDINLGHLDYINFVFGAIGAAGIPLYLFVARTFVEKDFDTLEEEESSQPKDS